MKTYVHNKTNRMVVVMRLTFTQNQQILAKKSPLCRSDELRFEFHETKLMVEFMVTGGKWWWVRKLDSSEKLRKLLCVVVEENEKQERIEGVWEKESDVVGDKEERDKVEAWAPMARTPTPDKTKHEKPPNKCGIIKLPLPFHVS